MNEVSKPEESHSKNNTTDNADLTPPIEYTLTKMKMDELFIHWLSHREANDLIQQLIISCKNGETISIPTLPNILAPCFGINENKNSPDIRSGNSGRINSPTNKNNNGGKGNKSPPRSPTHRSPRIQSPRSLPHSPESVRKELEMNESNESLSSPVYQNLQTESTSPKQLFRNEQDIISPSSSSTLSPSSSTRTSTNTTTSSSTEKTIPLPKFYIKNEGGRGRGDKLNDIKTNKSFSYYKIEIQGLYRESTHLNENEFIHITKNIIGLPSLVNRPLMKRINEYYDILNSSSSSLEGLSDRNNINSQKGKDNHINLKVSFDALVLYWENEIEKYDINEIFYRLFKKIDNLNEDKVNLDDLQYFVNEVLLYHPGLQFLHNHEEFMEKYSLTVSTRILYSCNYKSRSGFLTLKEFRENDILQVWLYIDHEEDINRCTQWFSYEHFYVLYCRFWELDSDHDGSINREDLLRYGGHRLSRVIVDHIFDIGHRPQLSNRNIKRNNNMMKYDDFIYFMLSEEDKGNIPSLKYWFTCVDGDGDDKITPMDMKIFYDVQSARMEALGHEVVSFEDILCQMSDMIKPSSVESGEGGGYILLSDLVKKELIKHAGVIFDALFNLEKFVNFEQRDPFQERHKRNDPFDCDWDRFAYAEYNRLAQEEEAREEMDVDNGQLGEWGDGGGMY